jgi:protein transport protein SEC24
MVGAKYTGLTIGLRVSEHFGNFYQRSLTDLEFGCIDSSKAFSAVVKHEGGRLDDRQRVYFQVATLYTAADGSRRVRCINLSLEATVLIGNVFKFADLDTSVTMFAKEGTRNVPNKKH